MDVVIYTDPDNPEKDILLKQVSPMIPTAPVMVFSIKGLFQLLKYRVSGEIIVVFLISSEDELDTLARDRPNLFNTRHIIILPGHRDTMVSKALALEPRYLEFTTHGYVDIGNVLMKMIRQTRF